MGYKLLKTGTVKGANRVSDYFPNGRYNALALVVKGEAAEGQELSKHDIGRIRIQRRGAELQGRDFAFYHDLSNLYGGFPRAITPSGGDTRIVAWVPFAHAGFPNTLDVQGHEEAQYFLDFDGVLDTRFGSNPATFELYGLITPDIPMSYELLVRQQDQEASAAGRPDFAVRVGNIGSLFLRDLDGVVGNVQVSIDGETLSDNIDKQFLLDVTNIERRIEAAGNDLTEILVASGASIEETRNESTRMQVQFTGAGTLGITALAFRWLGDDARESMQRVRRRLAAKRAQGGGSGLPAGAVRMPGNNN